MASYHDALFIRWRTSRHVPNSSHRPRAFWTAIMADFTLRPWLGTSHCVCTYGTWLAGGTVTGMFVHFPAKRSRSAKEIHPLVITVVSITSNLSSLSSGTSKIRASVSQIMSKSNIHVVGSSTHVMIDMK